MRPAYTTLSATTMKRMDAGITKKSRCGAETASTTQEKECGAIGTSVYSLTTSTAITEKGKKNDND